MYPRTYLIELVFLFLKNKFDILEKMISDPQKNISEFGIMPGQIIADFGSGAGHYAFPISTLVGNKGKVICIDIKKDSLISLKNTAVREGKTNLEIILGDIEKQGGTKLKDEAVDGVIFSNLLFQLMDKAGAINEGRRILKPGGKIYVVEWSDTSVMSGMKLGKDKMILGKDELINLMKNNGLSLEKNFEAGEHHYGLIFKK